MTAHMKQLVAQALKLDDEGRALLADALLASLHGPSSPAIDAAWLLEIEDRLVAYDRGEMPARPARDVLAKYLA